jgi:hypothetical protein
VEHRDEPRHGYDDELQRDDHLMSPFQSMSNTERARYYEARAGEYYRAGMQNQGDRALGMANFYWVYADKPQMQRAYPGTSIVAVRGRTRSYAATAENPIDPNTKILLIGGAMVAGAVGIALVFLANKAKAAS